MTEIFELEKRKSDAAAVSVAPYALVRLTSARYPAESRQNAACRRMLRRLVQLDAEAAGLLPTLCDALYASRDGHSEEFHREVVLPLRRALFNGRDPGRGLLHRLEDLPQRVPQLRAWLGVRAERALVGEQWAEVAGRALAAERGSLAALCAEPALLRAVALTSGDLLRAVQRAARTHDPDAPDGGHADPGPDRRGRKEEPGVLRYALRASTKTSPLTWFTAVGWGRFDDGRAGEDWDRAAADWAGRDALAAPTAVTRPNHALVQTFLDALLDDPRRAANLPYRLCCEPRLTETRATFLRTRLQLSAGRFLTAGEDEVEVDRGGPLDLVINRARRGILLEDLVGALCARFRPGRRDTPDRALAFVRRLTDARILVPVPPVDPQAPDPLPSLAAWLRGLGDGELARRVEALSAQTVAFADAVPQLRGQALRALTTQWAELFAAVHRPEPNAPVLTEDLFTHAPAPLGGLLSADDRSALAQLAPFAELFDVGLAVRDSVKERFVARYGHGGVCARPWEFAPEFRKAWQDAQTPAAVSTEVWQDEIVLDPNAVQAAAGRGGARPVSYSFFVQRDEDGLLCVNHIHGGWGRFTSRFLSALGPAAAADVTRQIHAGLGPSARPVQVRPVGGFNANLHPRLVPDELGEERRWATLTEGDVELVHDVESDQVRVRLRGDGRLLDVLYAGFLAPVMLPDRLGPFVNDFPEGVVSFAPLIPGHTVQTPGGPLTRTPRLRYRHLVLRRRRWYLADSTLAALRADLAAGGEVPVAAVARWRALLDLPEQVFIHPAPTPSADRSSNGFLEYLSRPKPHLADLGNALHVRCLGRWLARHGDGAVLEEALPAAGGRAQARRAAELVVETYRSGS